MLTLMSSPSPIQQLDFESSPMFLRRTSTDSPLNDDEEDDGGFLEGMDNMEVRHLHTEFLLLKKSTKPLFFFLRCFITSPFFISQFYLHQAPKILTICDLQDESRMPMPMGMAFLLMAPLVTDGSGEDSVSLSAMCSLVYCMSDVLEEPWM